jgi:Na+-driven multidrug efflux pump
VSFIDIPFRIHQYGRCTHSAALLCHDHDLDRSAAGGNGGAFLTADPAINAIGANYLLINGPTYVLLGAGSALFFASQGLGSVTWPFLAISSRLALLVALGWVAKPALGLGLQEVFIANAASIAWAGLAIMLVFWLRSRRV